MRNLLTALSVLCLLAPACGKQNRDSEVAVASVSVSPTSKSLTVEETVQLSATVSPSNATNKTLEWKSSAPAVATVSNTGLVTAVQEGTASITVSCGGKSASCSITVSRKKVAVTGVTLDRTELTLWEGEQGMLTATVVPADASDKAVTWKSGNPEVATVKDGLVTAVKAGVAEISVTSEDGGFKGTCSVTVKEKPKATAVTIDMEPIVCAIGQSVTVNVSFTPSDAVCSFEWASSDTRVATVKGDGGKGVIETKDFGVATITVKEIRSGLSASIQVSTTVSDFAWTVDSGETYDGAPLVTIEKETTYQLQFTCMPASASKLFADLSQWDFMEKGEAVSQPTIVSIGENGLVTTVKGGLLRIAPKGRISAKEGAGILYIKVKAADVNADGDNEDVGFEDWN